MTDQLEHLAALAAAAEPGAACGWYCFHDAKLFGMSDEDARFFAAAWPERIAALVAEVVAARAFTASNNDPGSRNAFALMDARARTDAAMEAGDDPA